jgi:hypothetical protein
VLLHRWYGAKLLLHCGGRRAKLLHEHLLLIKGLLLLPKLLLLKCACNAVLLLMLMLLRCLPRALPKLFPGRQHGKPLVCIPRLLLLLL